MWSSSSPRDCRRRYDECRIRVNEWERVSFICHALHVRNEAQYIHIIRFDSPFLPIVWFFVIRIAVPYVYDRSNVLALQFTVYRGFLDARACLRKVEKRTTVLITESHCIVLFSLLRSENGLIFIAVNRIENEANGEERKLLDSSVLFFPPIFMHPRKMLFFFLPFQFTPNWKLKHFIRETWLHFRNLDFSVSTTRNERKKERMKRNEDLWKFPTKLSCLTNVRTYVNVAKVAWKR